MDASACQHSIGGMAGQLGSHSKRFPPRWARRAPAAPFGTLASQICPVADQPAGRSLRGFGCRSSAHGGLLYHVRHRPRLSQKHHMASLNLGGDGADPFRGASQ